MSQPFVAILMGSDSDLPKVKAAIDVLKKLDVLVEARVLSAHRTPDVTHNYIIEAEKRGAAAFICCAGMAAHLAGAVAALTIKPVIGVPIDAGPLDGLDALLSTVQMPGGVPVATVAIGKAGAKNAGYLAAQIIALSDPDLTNRLKNDRKTNAEAVLQKDAELQQQLSE
ncbi:N5-carboxyaminoimidazole ribonucleotide mutase [invertebrate metagenome]|uniref:N5-carboxyaminoimidazole ribonucleotide mutase n=1 Tax=invertebrate metagenome TaxID=1711999 RepID=A0A2H9T6R9_9ZZZZ